MSSGYGGPPVRAAFRFIMASEVGMGGNRPEKRSPEGIGFLSGAGAYFLWGLFPLYWKMLSSVAPLQILAHRVTWAFMLTVLLSLILGRRKAIVAIFRNPKKLLVTFGAGFLVTANWGIYIWAVNTGRIIETSLGYYLNPLVSVALGGLVLKEKLDKGIVAACAIAVVGITILTVSYGRLPWVALALAGTFAVYGLMKKMIGLDSLMGLAIETTLVFPLAVGYLVFEQLAGRGAIFSVGAFETGLLVFSGVVTVIPLFLYAEGVKRVALSKLGFFQYIAPTLQLLIGVLVFGEVLEGARAIAFAFIVSALAIFALTRSRKSVAAHPGSTDK